MDERGAESFQGGMLFGVPLLALVVFGALLSAGCSESHLPPPTPLSLAPGQPLRIVLDLGGGADSAEATVTGGGASATGPFEVLGGRQLLHGQIRLQTAEDLADAWLTLPFVTDLDGQPNDGPRFDTTRTAVAPDGLRGVHLGALSAGQSRDVELDLVAPLGPLAGPIAMGGWLRDDAGAPSLQIELEDAFRDAGAGFYVSRNRSVYLGDGYAVVPGAAEGGSRSATIAVSRAGRYHAWVRQIAAAGDVRVDLSIGSLDVRLEGTDAHVWVDLGETELPVGDVPLVLTPVGDGRLGLDTLALVPSGAPAPAAAGLDATAGALDPIVAGASLHEAIASRLAASATRPPDELGRALREAMSLEPLPTAVPDYEVVDTIDDGPCTLELLWFEGGNGPVPANLYLPDDADGPRPAILNPIGHWAGGKAKEAEQLRAAGFCRLGFVSLSFDTFWQGERAGDLDDHFLGTFDVLSGDSFAGMLHGESVRAVSLLASLPEVDPDRIGVTGASGGGMVSAYLATIDDRIAASVPVVYTTDWEWLLLESLQGDPDQIPYGPAEIAPLPEFWSLIAPRPLLFITAADDGIFPASVARRVFPSIEDAYAAAGAPGAARFEIVPGGHGYGPDARRLAFDFFLAALGEGGTVDELPAPPLRTEGELAVHPPNPRTLVDVHVARADAIRPTADRARLDALLTAEGFAVGPARRVAAAPGVERWALDGDSGREVSALVLGAAPVRQVVVVDADAGLAGATVVPWLLGEDRAVIVVESTGIGSQAGPYRAVNGPGFSGHGKYAAGHPLLVGLTGMAMARAELAAAAALARDALGAEQVVLCGEGLGAGAAVIAIGAADGTYDAVIGVDGLASYREAARWARPLPPALVARDLFAVGDLPDLAELLPDGAPLLLVAPRDATLAPLDAAAFTELGGPGALLEDLAALGAAMDELP